MKKLLLLTTMCVITQITFAYDYYIDGFYYNRLSPYELEVSYMDETYNSYEGDISIPQNVIVNGKSYEVSSIGESAFRDCVYLTSVTIPSSIIWIKDDAFRNCTKLESISIPYGVTQLGNSVFSGCSALKSVSLPNSLTSLGEKTFAACMSISSIEIPDNITTFGGGNFMGCWSLKTVILPNKIKNLGDWTFENCKSLKSINLPEELTVIGTYCFAGSGLYSIKIPNKVTKVWNATFNACESLSMVVLGPNIEEIKVLSFSGCPALSSIYCFASYPPNVTSNNYGQEIFDENHYSNVTIYVPIGCLELYKTATYWNKFSKIIEFDPNTFDESIIYHQYIDLGLPSGNLWATCNIGANSPEEYGNYYAWAETSPKDIYDWSTYKYCDGSNTTLTKYCYSLEFGDVDNKYILDEEDDVATMNWGKPWRLPTEEEAKELCYNCTWEMGELNGIKGCYVTGSNGKSIFFPLAGYKEYNSTSEEGEAVYLLLSTLYKGNEGHPDYGNILFCNNSQYGWGGTERNCGLSARAVTNPNPSGIRNLNIDHNKNVDRIYDMQGRRIPKTKKGFNIIRMSDGRTKKVVVK